MLFAGGQPILQVHPSRLCNLACKHCYSSSGPGLRGQLPLGLLEKALEDAVACGYRRLAVSGGEPLLFGPLGALLAKAKSLGMITTLTTNGMLATAQRWRAIAPHLDSAAVSIDGREAEHDLIRGRAGAFARTLCNLATLRESGVAFLFIFTLTQHNVDSLEYVVELAAAHGARGVQVHPLTLHGRALRQMAGARPDQLELLAAIVEAKRLGLSLGVEIHVDALTLEQVLTYRDHLVPAKPFRATDVSPILVLEADGTLMPFTHELSRRFRLGSIHEAGLAELMADWLANGTAEELARICQETWDELAAQGSRHAFYWYEEVAARSHEAPEIAVA
jgi:MoaA/NifB/PqqE/SkfB family radical SAM enzyme